MTNESIPRTEHRAAAPSDERLYAIDALRLTAALLVLLHHWNWVMPAALKLQPWYPDYLGRAGGQIGVSLFFLISGFVILMSASGKSAQGFIVSRVVRLYPAFWVCCTLSWLVMVLDPTAPNFGEFLVNLTMLPGPAGVPFVDGVYWTLALEAKFYLLIAIVLALGQLHRIERVLWVWLALSWLPLGLGWNRFVMTEWAPFFIAGCACQLLREQRTQHRWLLFLVAAALAVNANSFGIDYAKLAQLTWLSVLLPAIVALECLAVLAVALGWLRLRRSWAVVQAGAISYPIYLLHKEIGYRVIKGFDELEAGMLLMAAALAVLAMASAVAYFEPRLQRRLRQALQPH